MGRSCNRLILDDEINPSYHMPSFISHGGDEQHVLVQRKVITERESRTLAIQTESTQSSDRTARVCMLLLVK